VQPTDKPRLREKFGDRRRQHSADEREQARGRVREHVLRRCTWSAVAAYVPMRTEPGSLELLQQLTTRGVHVIVPVVLPDRDLDWAGYPDGASASRLGVDSIATVDAVLVPALAVARDGTRLGRGGGSYDRALRRVPRTTPSIALLFEGELVDELPRDPWDVAVTWVVTPAGWQAVGESSDGLRS
jgi:5-formyltetrahydrofolate cyclo-ligase